MADPRVARAMRQISDLDREPGDLYDAFRDLADATDNIDRGE